MYLESVLSSLLRDQGVAILLYLLMYLFVRNIFIEQVHGADHLLGTKDAAMNRRAWSLPSCGIESSGETQLASPSLHVW